MNCKYLKRKLNKTIYCNKLKKVIKMSSCNNCKYKEYKTNICEKSTKIKKITPKLAKLERNRKSILTDNLDYCIICGSPKEHLHEVFFGKNRLNSIKYNCVIPLCSDCHTKIHNDIELDLFYKKMCQKKFLEFYHKDLNGFIDIFKKNYL